MRHAYLDRYSRLDSPLHRLPAAVKLGATVVLIGALVAFSRPEWTVLGVVALLLVALSAASRVPALYLVQRLLLLEPLVLGVAGLGFFHPDGWRQVLFLISRSTLCLWTALLLANTTPFDQLLALLRRLRLPPLLLTVLSLLYRYLFVLIDEAERMQRARASRTFAGTRGGTWRRLGDLAGQLFVRSTGRAERIYLAMRSRGWE
jgi:cobalt/nickel transport system permease protein